jgi:hypothetical protein
MSWQTTMGSIHSWNHLCWLFTSIFCATCAHPGVDWNLDSVVQKKGEPLWEFIQYFCNKRNIIPQVDDKSIVMFFRKGLRDPTLIHKLTLKIPRMLEAIFAIANKHALAKEATLDTREQKKEKDSGHADQPSSSKGHSKKRKTDCSINAVEWPQHNKEYRPRLGEFEGFLDRICIFTPRESTRPGIATNSKVSQMKYSERQKGLIKRRSPKNLRATSSKLTRRPTISMVALILMSQGGSRKS